MCLCGAMRAVHFIIYGCFCSTDLVSRTMNSNNKLHELQREQSNQSPPPPVLRRPRGHTPAHTSHQHILQMAGGKRKTTTTTSSSSPKKKAKSKKSSSGNTMRRSKQSSGASRSHSSGVSEPPTSHACHMAAAAALSFVLWTRGGAVDIDGLFPFKSWQGGAVS